jgi:hypothetical protein
MQADFLDCRDRKSKFWIACDGRTKIMKHKQAATSSSVFEGWIFKSAAQRSRSDFTCRPALSSSLGHLASGIKFALLVAILGLATSLVFAKVTGSISGTVRDAGAAVVPGVSVQLRSTDTGVVEVIETDSAGFYNFPAVPVGHYEITFRKTGFGDFKQTNLVINVDTSLQVDATLNVGAMQQQVNVTSTPVQVDTRTAQVGEVIGEKEMTNLPLNGRSYTDLLALQPGVVPIPVGQYGSLSPSNDLNNGLLSIGGARDVNSGFMVNGANTVEGFGNGTTVVPNLDSIAEFRIITSNAGAEYGNYAGGQVNVVTKSGTNSFHGDVFEFLRNSSLDARNYFSPTRAVFHQNQFGATFGGPIVRDKLFFFVDYQGTRQTIGVDTGRISVPSAAERQGDFSDEANALTGAVNGAYWANILSGRLGYTVTAGEPYYTTGCTSSANCVFPNAVIPQSAWSNVSPNVIPLIPMRNSGQFFATSANPETLQDDKGGIRIDANTRFGMISGYYHDDPWINTSPYSGYGGSSVPGFPNESVGKAQLVTLGITKSFGATVVNQFTASYMRNKNISGLVGGGPGPSLASLGFAPPQDEGIYQLSTQYQNWPTLSFNSYTLGSPESIVSQFNNTYQLQDDFTKVIGTHTLKFGADYHWDQIAISHPNNASNGGFGFSGDETGIDFADMLIGAPSYFFQGAPAGLNLRSYYAGAYAEDSWRATHNLTINYGVRWEVDPYWADANDHNPVILLGVQSTTFPTAPTGYVFPGDAGVPKHMAKTRWNDFGPRIGLAYSTDFSSGFMHSLFGDQGKSSIRLGFGQYYTNIEGANTFNFAAAPYGLFYFSSAPPLFDTPFITRASGQNLGQRFPVPPLTSGANVDWTQFEPLSGRNPLIDSPSPYAQHLTFSIQREITENTLLSLSYVGTFGHHLVVNADANPGNAALCLGLSDPSEVMPGTATCGPFGENGIYYPVGGGVVNSTRAPFGAAFAGVGHQLDIGNSTYHALETTLRHSSGRMSFLVSYTYSKAMDDGSGFGDQVILNPNGSVTPLRGLSIYDMTHNFVASYTYELPFDKLFGKDNRVTRGWKISGITQFTTGVPVTILEPDDQSLLGNTGNSGYYGSTDEPDYASGQVVNDGNPRDGKPFINTSLFSLEPLGGQGTSRRRFFHGPGMNNWNLSLIKDLRLTESKSLEFRGEFFNAFNHAQFYGAFAVDGNFSDGPNSFGMVNSAAAPRIGQLGVKFLF